jgi:hypothetical protein
MATELTKEKILSSEIDIDSKPPADKAIPEKPPADKAIPVKPPADKAAPVKPPADKAPTKPPANMPMLVKPPADKTVTEKLVSSLIDNGDLQIVYQLEIMADGSAIMTMYKERGKKKKEPEN